MPAPKSAGFFSSGRLLTNRSFSQIKAFLFFLVCAIIDLVIWRRIEVVITSLTRNQVVGQPARGFESHRLRLLKTPRVPAREFFLSLLFLSLIEKSHMLIDLRKINHKLPVPYSYRDLRIEAINHRIFLMFKIIDDDFLLHGIYHPVFPHPCIQLLIQLDHGIFLFCRL